MSDADFSSLGLLPALQQNLVSLGYMQMTAIQQLSLPPVLAGKDVLAQGKTGSGKTAAFGLGILNKLDIGRLDPQALVLCPTRELADQVCEEIRRLARTLPNVKVLSLCGGRPVAVQADSLSFGAHIIVGTPGRIEDHLRRESLKLDHISCLVLDEADRMLDMGFLPSVETIIDMLKPVQPRAQVLLFSATYPSDIQRLANSILQDPVSARLEENESAPDIEQLFYKVSDEESRVSALKRILLHFKPETALVFCTTRNDTDEVCRELQVHGFAVLALHGEMDQRERDQTFIRFSNGSARVLVATDVAARGLDVTGLDLVINYHPARDEETHTHRIGRTGRAGSTGRACTLLTGAQNRTVFSELPPLSLLKQRPEPASMLTLQIDGGKRDKIRPTDVLGALTGTGELSGSDIGKIRITHNAAYVAVSSANINLAQQILAKGKIKGKTARTKRLD
ncbi:MAG: ATP-dependent RNA helicase DbpA [Pseudohongiella sp.]|nr:ATP-dependent RNA helicase DbpA [Pseudohongiella sp.]MDO9519634.1 ATP-dependent RNA helicase DbpA [Pseudohongiella sp.]